MGALTRGKARALLALLAAGTLSAGCGDSKGQGETVPPPPRELIEKSYQAKGAPPPPPGASAPGTRP